jgi:Kef-type K+ transport system membrane component KefB
MESTLVQELQELQHWLLINQVGNKGIYLLGILTFLAFLTVILTKKIKAPIVVGYVFLGILLSTDVIQVLPFLEEVQKEWYEFTLKNLGYITDIALAFIAFTIGSELSLKLLKSLGKNITIVVFLEAVAAFSLVTLSIIALGQPIYVGLLLGAIASATAPAATVMVIKEYKAEGPLTSMIMAVVGIDDAIALTIFSFIQPIAFIQYSGSGELSLINSLLYPLLEIFGSVLIGLVVGFISQKYILKVENKTKKIMTIVSTIIGGVALSILFHLSPLITNMSIGFAYRNFARKNPGIEGYMDTLTTPLYAMFFVLAGTEIQLSSIASGSFLLIAFVYILARLTGKVGGAYLGGVLTNAPDKIKKYVGLGLFPQSGVAIALAYTVQKQFASAPEVGLLVFNTLLFTAALTEVIGPLATKYALTKAGEVGQH